MENNSGNGEIKKKIYDMSEDEQHNWELKKEAHDEPFRLAATAIAAGIDTVLEALGVNTRVDSDDKLQAQMMSLGVFIKEYTNQPDVAPQIQGYYVFQARFKTPLDTVKDIIPIAFIGNPQVNSTGEIAVEIHWLDKLTMDVVKAGQLKEE